MRRLLEGFGFRESSIEEHYGPYHALCHGMCYRVLRDHQEAILQQILRKKASLSDAYYSVSLLGKFTCNAERIDLFGDIALSSCQSMK